MIASHVSDADEKSTCSCHSNDTLDFAKFCQRDNISLSNAIDNVSKDDGDEKLEEVGQCKDETALTTREDSSENDARVRTNLMQIEI